MKLQHVLSGRRTGPSSQFPHVVSTSNSDTQLEILNVISTMPIIPSRFRNVLTRAIDIVFGSLMLLTFLPLITVIALLIKCEDKGPVLYRQERLGLYGKSFMLLKFRSMRVDAEASGPVWASVQDPRVTWIGSILRLTRLDELPQLWNIVTGDMTLVGPRPERAAFTELLTKHIPDFRFRMVVKPGLTGWAQVNLPYSATIEEARAKFLYDLYYIKNFSIRLNMIILFKTIEVVVCMKGR